MQALGSVPSLRHPQRLPEITMEVSKCSNRSCERATDTWLLGGINYRLNFLGCKIVAELSLFVQLTESERRNVYFRQIRAK